MEAARSLKANMKLAGAPCGWCQTALALGDNTAVCTACTHAHHQQCWDGRAGCATAGCMNAPLRRLDEAPAAPAAAVGSSYAAGSPFPSGAAPSGSPFPSGAPAFGGPAVAFGGAPPPPGYAICPGCRSPALAGSMICPLCRAILSPDGIYHGPKMTAPDAKTALICGIVGLLFCGVVLGPLAISKASAAKQAIAKDPTLSGEGLATAGMVLGILDLVFFVIVLALRMSSL